MSTDISRHSEGISTLKEIHKCGKPLKGENALVIMVLYSY
jgi:hypothetical protein